MIEYAVIAAVLGLLFWQLVLPNIRSRKPGGTTPANPPAGTGSWKEGAKKYAWPLLLVGAAIAIAVWGGLFEASPSAWTFASVHKYVWGHGPALLLIAMVAAIAIAIYGGTKQTALFKALGFTVLALFALPWVLSWFEPSSKKTETEQQVAALPNAAAAPKPVPLATAPQSTWPTVTIPAGGTSVRIPLPLGMHRIRVAGYKYKLHTVYQGGNECESFGAQTCPEGAVLEYYVTNEAEKTDVVSYAFVRK